MLKTLISSTLVLSTLLIASTSAEASPSRSSNFAHRTAAGSPVCQQTATGGLILIRDARASMGGGGNGGGGGGGGNANSCWSACFSTYTNCMDRGPKDFCVSRMKTCLAVCDTSAN